MADQQQLGLVFDRVFSVENNSCSSTAQLVKHHNNMAENSSVIKEAVMSVIEGSFPEWDEICEHRSIFQIARDGDVEAMQSLLVRLGPARSERVIRKINTLDENKVGILHYAARYEHLRMVKLIVYFGADVNIRGEDGLTPLHSAAKFKIISKMDQNSAKSKKSEFSSPTYKLSQKLDSFDIEDILAEEIIGKSESSSVTLYLATQGADVNARDKYGLTPLHYAAMRGNDDAANDLLQLPNTNLEAQDQQRLTPLHLACSYGQTQVAKILLQHGANIRCFGEQHQSALHKAASVGNFELVRMLLKAALDLHGELEVKSLLQDKDLDQNTALSLAVESGSAQISEELIKHGSNVNHCNKHRVYPLHSACTNGTLDIVKVLVQNEASIDCLNSLHQTPLAVAAAFNHVAIIEFLLKCGAQIEAMDKNGYTPLLLAASEGNSEAVDVLLQSGANIFCMDKEDRTVLYWAAMQNHKNVLDVLLNDSQSLRLLKACDRFDNSPLHVACERGYHDIATTLIEAGAEVDNKNEDERTPLHLAAKEGRVKIIKEILKRDTFAVHDEDSESNSSLHLACINGHSLVVSTLLAYGADIKSRNYYLWTPLDCAAAYGQIKCAKILLDANADIDPMDKNKTTPLHLAARYGHERTAKLLIERGASVTQANTLGHNPLVTAILHGKRDVAEVIIESQNWMAALKCEFKSSATHVRDSPIRMLIKTMPELAKRVFDKCMESNLQKHTETMGKRDGSGTVSAEDPRFQIDFNFELLDDSYTIFHKANSLQGDQSFFLNIESLVSLKDNQKSLEWHKMDLFDDTTNHLVPEAEPYTSSSTLMKLNHPLMIMVKEERVNLLGHPLCMALVRHKWNSFGRYVYYLTLAMFLLFVAFLTEFLVNSPAPYSAKQIMEHCQLPDTTNGKSSEDLTLALFPRNGSTVGNTCELTEAFCTVGKRKMALISKIIIICLAAFHLLKELFQIFQARLSYFGTENVIEWTCYVTAILFVVDFSDCQSRTGLRLGWQWQIGAISVTMSWLNLLSNVRKFPFLGIYVVMFTDVLQTFLRFSIICALFVIAFSLGFYALFAEQENFATVGISMLKTSVMAIGEFEYDNLFFDNPEKNGGDQLPYRTFSMVFFLGFMIVMPIIIMNLLVGLAVDDIKTVQDNAVLSRLAMQVTLNLDVERMLPDFIRRRFIVKQQTILPNQKKGGFLAKFLMNDNALNRITKGIRAGISNESELSQLGTRLDDVLAKMKAFKDQLKQVSQDLEGNKAMLAAVAKKTGVDFTEEEE